jgi:hydrogenase maturation protein HypF
MTAECNNPESRAPETARLRLAILGAVQGVGFRPFIFRLATGLGLTGWVNNSGQGVFVEVEGPEEHLRGFLARVKNERPPRSSIHSLEATWLDPAGFNTFEIRASDTGGVRTALVMPDIATCPDCLKEIFEPSNRRHFYPFTNCTNCGPRFTIIQALPYDRANTSMQRFRMCPDCQAEYDNPLDRRFHAQPNACPACGPHLELWNADGRAVADPGEPSLRKAAEAIRDGKIVAVKGLGGFQLMVNARVDEAVRRLRERKHREEKPLAVMFPTLAEVRAACEVSPLEEQLLLGPESPILLLRRRAAAGTVSDLVAPGNPNLGVMVPYTPLHHLLLAVTGVAVVATSGNLSDEPICTDEQEARQRLGAIADLFLVHNRPIVRHVDDSIARVILGRTMVLRRARGYAPLPIPLAGRQFERHSVLAVGAHLKNTIALAVGPQVFISQHIGDLETDRAFEAFRSVIRDLQCLYETTPEMTACDAHPDYLSTQWSLEQAPVPGPGPSPPVRVQHHVAHVLSCMAENELEPPVLGVSWDGTGYGLDGSVWGGEFLLVSEGPVERVAHLRQFRLPGGDKAVVEPRRSALALLYEAFGSDIFSAVDLAPLKTFSPTELGALQKMLERGLNAPLTSSVGRLFDAVASLVGLRQRVQFEGQAAMELEFAIRSNGAQEYEIPVAPAPQGPPPRPANRRLLVLDWGPMVRAIVNDARRGVSASRISAGFHNALVEAIIAVSRRIGANRVVLSGGCFQNAWLIARAVHRLREEGFRPCWHQRVPPNDGGISLGQIVAATGGYYLAGQ